MKTIQLLFLTDITLHTRGFRQTAKFSTAAEKGRIYFPLPADYNQPGKETAIDPKTGQFRISIELPSDLKEKLSKGEIKIMAPQGGLNVYAGTDVKELIAKMNQKKRRELIHKSRTWHSGKKEI